MKINKGELFNLITRKCQKTRGLVKKLISKDYQEGVINNMDLKPFHATKFCKNPLVYGVYDIDKSSWFTERINGELIYIKKYEYELGCPIEFLCDPDCKSNSSKNSKCCSEGKRDTKRAFMFFRYKTVSKKDCNSENIKANYKQLNKSYVLLQLANHKTVSFGYYGYILDKETRLAVGNFQFKSDYPTRRRDLKLTVDLDKEKTRILSNISNRYTRSTEGESIDFYNKYLRMGNEIFIPQYVTNMLLHKFI